MSPSTSLVTGATGLIGSWVAKTLVERGDRVRALVRPTSDLTFLRTLPVELCVGDLGSMESLRTAARGTDIVFHCGAKVLQRGSWEEYRRANVDGTRAVLEAARGAGAARFVHVSTVGIFGLKDLENVDESHPLSRSGNFYTDSKIDAEMLVREWMAQRTMRITIVYPTLIYGPRDGNLTLTAVRILKRGIIPAVGGARSRASFTYVENLAEAVVAAGSREIAVGRTYIIGDGEAIPWMEFFSRLARELGLRARVVHIPVRPIHPLLAAVDFCRRALHPRDHLQSLSGGFAYLASRRTFNTSRARTELSWGPGVPMDEGIRRTANWVRGAGHL